MSNSEVKVGSLIRVKVGRNLILARVLEVLNDGFRVCSVAKNKEFNVPQSRVQFDGEQPAPANTEPQAEATAQTEQASTEQQSEQESAEATAEPEAVAQTEQEPAEPEPQVEQPEAAVQTEPEAEQPEAPVEAAEQEAVTVEAEPSTVEVVPEDEAAEFTPSGEDEEDEEDEYAINPAHESDKPVKRMSLLNAAVEVLKAAGSEHPMNCKEILEAILERQLWIPTNYKTPEQTLYGSIFREINAKEQPRIKKSDVKGKFVIAE